MEEQILLVVSAVMVVVVASVFARRSGIAAPLVLLVVGIAASVIPALPTVTIAPEIILTVVLPPLLYGAAVNVPATDFRRDVGAIGALSVVLVLISAFAVGVLVWWVFPDLSFAAAVAVGAVVSPPDAVAATAVGRRLGLPPRLLTILEGEGLVNDATALVLLRTAVAATAGVFTFWDAVGSFAYAVTGAAAVGVLVAAVTVWLRASIDDPVATTAISFAVPFLAFLPAERIGASGVLAVVVAGLITGAQAPRRFTSQDRIAERTIWRTVLLVLENGVFLVMGYQLMTLVRAEQTSDVGLWTAVGIGLAVTAALLVVRTAFVLPLVLTFKRRQDRGPRRQAALSRMIDRLEDGTVRLRRGHGQAARFLRQRHADAGYYVAEGLGWRAGAVLAWSGMRGVVTLAAAQSLPHSMPYREPIILIAFTVAVTTLLLQGGTLPLLIRRLGVQAGGGRGADRYAELLERLGRAGQAVLSDRHLVRDDGSSFGEEVIDDVRRTSLAAMVIDEHGGSVDRGADRVSQRQELRRMVVEAEHEELLRARADGAYSSRLLERAQEMIDAASVHIDRRG